MFEELCWQHDRMLLDGLVFRIEHSRNENWELGDRCFRLYKTKALIDQYAMFWSVRPQFRVHNILELGIWGGGSMALWHAYFQPEKLVGIDISVEGDTKYFQEYIASRGLGERLKTYWGINQADPQKLRQIVRKEFSYPLDLVIDDASHMYQLTKTSFETLFPLLRPGGLYVIEDWAWAHWKEFQVSGHPWSTRTPLTKLIVELVKATGSSRGLVESMSIFQGFAVVERSHCASPTREEFKIEKFISRRPNTTIFPRLVNRLVKRFLVDRYS